MLAGKSAHGAAVGRPGPVHRIAMVCAGKSTGCLPIPPISARHANMRQTPLAPPTPLPHFAARPVWASQRGSWRVRLSPFGLECEGVNGCA